MQELDLTDPTIRRTAGSSMTGCDPNQEPQGKARLSKTP